MEHFFHFIEFAVILKKDETKRTLLGCPVSCHNKYCHFNIYFGQSFIYIEHRDVVGVVVGSIDKVILTQ